MNLLSINHRAFFFSFLSVGKNIFNIPFVLTKYLLPLIYQNERNMTTYEYTGATLKFQTGDTTFEMIVKQANGYSKHKSEYVVLINQTTKVNDLEGCENCEDFKCTFKCVCMTSPTEHSALHFAGKKYIKNWNPQHRIGKDYPLN